MIIKAFTGNSCDSKRDNEIIIFDRDDKTAKDIAVELQRRNVYLSCHSKKSDNFKVIVKRNKSTIVWENNDRDVRRIVDSIIENLNK